MSVKTKMTAIADKIRSILGISGKMGLDAMVSNLQTCEDEVDLQEGLLEEALSTLNGKASGSSTAQNAALQNKEVTPSANEQIVTPDAGYDGLSYVYVVGDSDLTPGNIKSGVNIFGITGSYAGNQTDGDNLPSGISKISYGSFVPSSDLRTFQIQHGLDIQPATCNIFASGNINAADFEGYLVTCSILAHCQFDSSVNDGSGVKLQSTQWAVGSGGSIRNYSSWTDDDNSPMSSVDVKLSNISKFKAGIKYHWVCVALDDDV